MTKFGQINNFLVLVLVLVYIVRNYCFKVDKSLITYQRLVPKFSLVFYSDLACKYHEEPQTPLYSQGIYT